MSHTLFDVSDVENGLNHLKAGKACDFDGISKECIMYSHPIVIIHLKLLFSIICAHGFVPDGFGISVTVPC